MSASVWKKSSFSQIGEVIAGGTPSTTVSEYWNGNIPFVTPNDLSEQKSPYINKTERTITKVGLNNSSANLLPKNALILSTRAPIGYMALSSNECVTNQGCKAILINSDQCPLFHYYNTHNYVQKMKSLGSGTTFAEISKTDLEKIVVTYPEDFKTQKNIADILSTCDTVIQNTQKTIDKYKAIKQGMMQDLFTRGLTKDGKLRPSYKEAPELYKESELGMIPKEWNAIPMGSELISVGSGYCECYKDNGPYPVYGSTGIIGYSDKYDYSGEALLIARVGANAGLVNIVFGEYGVTDNTLIARFSESTGINYVLYYLRFINLNRLIFGSGQPLITGGILKKLFIKFPKIEEQLAIAKRLSSIDSTIQKEEAVLEKYKNIKTGLMARLLAPPKDAVIIDETEE